MTPFVTHGEKLIRRLGASFVESNGHDSLSGTCVKLHLESVQEGACEVAFLALSSKCFFVLHSQRPVPLANSICECRPLH